MPEKLKRIQELDAKGVYNLSTEELDELDILVKEQLALFPERFEKSVNKACSAIRSLLTRHKENNNE